MFAGPTRKVENENPLNQLGNKATVKTNDSQTVINIEKKIFQRGEGPR